MDQNDTSRVKKGMTTRDISYLIDDYLRLMQAGDLKHEEICDILGMDSKFVETILKMQQNQAYVMIKMQEFKMTATDLWKTVDKYLADGFENEYIAEFLNLPLSQVVWRRHFKETGLR